MVKLTKIYTRTGDDGSTGLGDGSRVPKTDIRVEAYGTVDEASAAIGLAVAYVAALPAPSQQEQSILHLLQSIQNDMFDVGADLCCPIAEGEAPGSRLRVTPQQITRLEHAIDLHNDRLTALNSFILPGGWPLAASLHLARTITRRAERRTVELSQKEPAQTNPETVRYLNRLSDLLFVLCRVANSDGAGDILWVPGANRK
ncbi:MAG: cob(I)yrinic acid a,c-diamide adenosyltransferase [Pyrinomonadaceae bacterium]|nr:cob(I)yrinic acid a,c-diamide adenosyltransferase [Phycisphaerales bacterium]